MGHTPAQRFGDGTHTCATNHKRTHSAPTNDYTLQLNTDSRVVSIKNLIVYEHHPSVVDSLQKMGQQRFG